MYVEGRGDGVQEVVGSIQFRGLLMGHEGFHVMAQGVPGHLQLVPGLA